jgi:PAS domain-containing protein
MASVPIVYLIDAEDRIVRVNPAWDEFARANDSPALLGRHMLGRALWDFIADRTIREIYRRLLLRVRDGRPMRYRYRCDSPRHRRVFEMQLKAMPDGGVEFTSTLETEEARPAVISLLDANAPRSTELVRMCSWCHGVRWAGESWVPLEAAVERLHLREVHAMPSLTHGICEPCAKKTFGYEK